jgi:hypothetical protein
LRAHLVHSTLSTSSLPSMSPKMEMDLDGRYSITSSARASSVGGTSMPSALAVLRLMISPPRIRLTLASQGLNSNSK